MFLAEIFCLSSTLQLIEGWDALHANPTVGSLGKGIWEVIYITQVHTEQFLGQLGPRVGEVFGPCGFGLVD